MYIINYTSYLFIFVGLISVKDLTMDILGELFKTWYKLEGVVFNNCVFSYFIFLIFYYKKNNHYYDVCVSVYNTYAKDLFDN